MLKIWFHGTSREASLSIRKEGFRPGTYFARALEDAIEFGGEYVFEVALEYAPIDDHNWQMVVGEHTPSSSIVRLTRYSPRILFEFPERQRRVFEANR